MTRNRAFHATIPVLTWPPSHLDSESAATDLLRSNINDMLSKVTIGSKMLFNAESVATLEDDVSHPYL